MTNMIRAAAIGIGSIGWLFLSVPALYAERPADRSLLTVDRIFGKKEFDVQKWGPAQWLKDGSGYTVLEASKISNDAKDVVLYHPQSGRRTVLVAAASLIAPGNHDPLKIDGYAWSDDVRKTS